MAIQQHGGGAGTGKPARSLSHLDWLKFRRSIASIPGNPFTDSHAISTLTDVTVNDLERVEMSTYAAGDTGGWFWISFTSTRHADYGSEGAVVLDLVNQDQSVQHVVATFPTEAFSGDSTDRGGKLSTISNHLFPPTDIAPSLSVDTF